MEDEPATVTRMPSADGWAAVGAVIAIGALILTVTGWLRDDIRSLGADLKTLGTGLDTLGGVVQTLSAEVDSIDKRLAVVESHVLGVPSVAQVEEGA